MSSLHLHSGTAHLCLVAPIMERGHWPTANSFIASELFGVVFSLSCRSDKNISSDSLELGLKAKNERDFHVTLEIDLYVV